MNDQDNSHFCSKNKLKKSQYPFQWNLFQEKTPHVSYFHTSCLSSSLPCSPSPSSSPANLPPSSAGSFPITSSGFPSCIPSSPAANDKQRLFKRSISCRILSSLGTASATSCKTSKLRSYPLIQPITEVPVQEVPEARKGPCGSRSTLSHDEGRSRYLSVLAEMRAWGLLLQDRLM